MDAAVAAAEDYLPEDDALAAARGRAQEVHAAAVSPGTGAALRMLAAAVAARAVVEVGTGCGVSGLWLLRGMAPDGVLTTIDSEPEYHRLARRTFAGLPSGRVRLITGRALQVLPRLTDGAYDLVFCDAGRAEYPEYLAEGLRLLRPGGVLLFAGADAPAQDSGPEAHGVRELLRLVREEEACLPALLPVGTGLLAVATRP